MELQFYKYNGTGNDFIMIDNRTRAFSFSQEQVAALCHRHFGIGADGLILLEETSGYDFKMVYYNSDGRESTMCGNGGRCIVQFAYDLGIIKNQTEFLAIDGAHQAEVLPGMISLQMINVTHIATYDAFSQLDTGSPHYVAFMETLPTDDFVAQARAIRNTAPYRAEGINVNFATVTGNQITMRTFERGVENETLACGTGATAVAIAAHANGLTQSTDIPVRVMGGDLRISFTPENNEYHQVWLTGPATHVFDGKLPWND